MEFNKNIIQGKISKYIYDNFIYDSLIEFKNKDSLTESGFVDSIGIIEFIDFLSNEFNIKIPDEELTPENLDTIDASTELVLKHIKNK